MEHNRNEEISWKRSFDGDEEEPSPTNLIDSIKSSWYAIAESFMNVKVPRDSQYQLLNPEDIGQPSEGMIEDDYTLNQLVKSRNDNSIINASRNQESDEIELNYSRNYKLFHIGQASTTSCVLNLINTTIGSGAVVTSAIFYFL